MSSSRMPINGAVKSPPADAIADTDRQIVHRERERLIADVAEALDARHLGVFDRQVQR